MSPQRPGRRPVTVILQIGVLVVVVLVVVALGADRLVRQTAEGRIAEEVGAQVGTPVEVSLDGGLAGLQVLLGRIPSMSLQADSVVAGDVVLDHLLVEVVDVRVEDDRPVAGAGTFLATLTEQQVRAAAPEILQGLVALEDDRPVIGTGVLTVPLLLTVDAGDLVVRLDLASGLTDLLSGLAPGLEEGLRIPLDLPEGVDLVGASVARGELELSGTLDPAVVAGP